MSLSDYTRSTYALICLGCSGSDLIAGFWMGTDPGGCWFHSRRHESAFSLACPRPGALDCLGIEVGPEAFESDQFSVAARTLGEPG